MKTVYSILVSLFLSVTFVLSASVSVSAVAADDTKENNWQGVERVVALGDVHGEYEQFIRVLRDAKLINQRNNWIGGKAHFVQTGDVPDRGPKTRDAMDLLMKLEKQAKKAGGMVHVLIGNHEAMNASGDLRYVTKKDYTAFRSRKSKNLRKAFYERYVDYVKNTTEEAAWPSFNKEYKNEWEKKFPLGWVEHRQNWSKQGKYGKWVASHNSVIIINDSIFMHGGISPKFATTALDSMNADIRADVFTSEGIAGDRDGPLWYRGLAQDDEVLLMDHVDQVLAHHKLKRIVVGHSRTKGAVRPRFGAKVLMIDVGLGKKDGSNFAYLDITHGVAKAVHRGMLLDIPSEPGQPYINYLEKAAALDPVPSSLTKRIAKQKEALINQLGPPSINQF